MKNVLKFVGIVVGVAAVLAGAYYFVKKYILDDDFDDFEEAFDDLTDRVFDNEEDREYVTLDIEDEAVEQEEVSESTETKTEE